MRLLIVFVMFSLAAIVGGFFGHLFGFWGLIPAALLGLIVGLLAGSITDV